MAHARPVANPQLPPTEQALVERARLRDESAIRELIARNNQRLFRTARAVLRDDAEAEDVVQETYVRAFTGRERFRGEAAFATWLTRIALNDALDRRRRRSLAQRANTGMAGHPTPTGAEIVMFPTAAPPLSPEAEFGRTEIRRLLEHLIDELPEAFRLVFVLREVEGLSTDEVARQLDIKPQTVKTRLHRARRSLREALSGTLESGLETAFPFAGARCAELADRVIARLDS
jgi:RNA polymerase sigma-70 factor (ECF subfamily)